MFKALLTHNTSIHCIYTDEQTNAQRNMRGVVLRLGSVVKAKNKELPTTHFNPTKPASNE